MRPNWKLRYKFLYSPSTPKVFEFLYVVWYVKHMGRQPFCLSVGHFRNFYLFRNTKQIIRRVLCNIKQENIRCRKWSKFNDRNQTNEDLRCAWWARWRIQAIFRVVRLAWCNSCDFGGNFPPMAQQPLVCQGLLIEASRSYSDTPLSIGLLWTGDHPDAETSTRQRTTRETDILALGGIRTHNPCKRAAADPRMRPRGHCRHFQAAVPW
jgi:hypothetical protein